MTMRTSLLLVLCAVLCLGCPSGEPDTGGEGTTATEVAATGEAATCTLTPGHLPTPPTTFDQPSADIYSWETFGAIAGQWQDWNTTADLICADGGTFIPQVCEAAHQQYPDARVLQQIGKVDDSFIEATIGGLSNLPVIDQNGNFLRYEILVYPTTAQWIKDNGLNKSVTAEVNFPCSGDPSAPSMNVKLAWMDVGACGGTAPTNAYSEDRLVVDPADATTSGTASCSCRTMALVGVHIVQKTTNQSAWVWSTFENQNNAPDCASGSSMPAPTAPNPGKDGSAPGPNTNCPTGVSGSYFLYGDCTACTTTCNTGPNKLSTDTCGSSNDNWCVDVPRDPSGSEAGTVSKLCRQISAGDYYSGATSWDNTPGNQACKPTSGPWSNYQLISTQWITPDTSACANESSHFGVAQGGGAASPTGIGTVQPTVATSSNKPFLANTSMESYERSNCLGCHAKSATATGNFSTDFVYYLALEVPESPLCNQ